MIRRFNDRDFVSFEIDCPICKGKSKGWAEDTGPMNPLDVLCSSCGNPLTVLPMLGGDFVSLTEAEGRHAFGCNGGRATFQDRLEEIFKARIETGRVLSEKAQRERDREIVSSLSRVLGWFFKRGAGAA